MFFTSTKGLFLVAVTSKIVLCCLFVSCRTNFEILLGVLGVAKFLKTVFECARIVRVLFTGWFQTTEVFFLLGVTSKIQLLCCRFVSDREIENFR